VDNANHLRSSERPRFAELSAPYDGTAASGSGLHQDEALAALAATLTSQQVTQYRTDAFGGEPNAANRLAGLLHNLAVELGELGRQEEVLAREPASSRHLPGAGRSPPRRLPAALAAALNNLALALAALATST
jgi:hypothetical protein